jgi:hypothetical protein
MRLVLDITATWDGRYEGSLTDPGTGGRQDFAGILELLTILEERLGPGGHEDSPPIRLEAPPISDEITDESNP